MLVPELDDVHPAGDAGARGRRPGRAGPACRGRGGAAERSGARAHAPACAFALAFAFMAFLVARTLARLSGSVMSATESELPSLP